MPLDTQERAEIDAPGVRQAVPDLCVSRQRTAFMRLDNTMLALEVLTVGGDRRRLLLAVDNISSMTPLTADRTAIVARDGHGLEAVGDCASIRAAIVRVLSDFDTPLECGRS